jgi:hypothetical protein
VTASRVSTALVALSWRRAWLYACSLWAMAWLGRIIIDERREKREERRDSREKREDRHRQIYLISEAGTVSNGAAMELHTDTIEYREVRHS